MFKSSAIPGELPVEITTLPAVLLVGGVPQVVTDLDKLEYALPTAKEFTPETLPNLISTGKPLMVFVVASPNSLLEMAANLYPLVTWLDQ